MRWSIIFIINSFHKLKNFHKKQNANIFQSVLILVLRVIVTEEIHLEDKEDNNSNVFVYFENNPYIFKNLQFYFIQNKSFKFMDKILKNCIHFKVKLHIWCIIYKE